MLKVYSDSIALCLLAWCEKRFWWMVYTWMHAASDYPRNRSHGSDYQDIYSVHCWESLFVLRHPVQLITQYRWIFGFLLGIHSSSHPYSLRGELELVSLTEENAVDMNSVGRVP